MYVFSLTRRPPCKESNRVSPDSFFILGPRSRYSSNIDYDSSFTVSKTLFTYALPFNKDRNSVSSLYLPLFLSLEFGPVDRQPP